MQIFDCNIHKITRASALIFALYLMYRFRNKKTDPIFWGGVVMAIFDLYTWINTKCL